MYSDQKQNCKIKHVFGQETLYLNPLIRKLNLKFKYYESQRDRNNIRLNKLAKKTLMHYFVEQFL